jgi:hypothetical protein
MTDLEDKECVICHEDLGASDSGITDFSIRTPCKHVIGAACLQNWLAIGKTTCPYCRRELLKDGDSETREDELEPAEIR